jgi:hypothetical protein
VIGIAAIAAGAHLTAIAKVEAGIPTATATAITCAVLAPGGEADTLSVAMGVVVVPILIATAASAGFMFAGPAGTNPAALAGSSR